MDSTKKTARLAGLLYLLASIPGAFALLYVPGKLVVRGDAAATAERLRSSATVLRMGIAAEIVSSVIFIFLVLVLYRLFRPVSEGSALAMMVLILLSIPISLFVVVLEVSAVEFAGGASGRGYLSALTAPQRDALAYQFLHLHGQGLMVAEVFWGLWLFPFGVCVIRSGFIPRFLGYLLILAAFGYLASSLSELVIPDYSDAVDRVAKILTALETPIIFWLLIWGARTTRENPARPA